MVSKGRHQKNEINAVLKQLPASVVVLGEKNGHNWGFLVCRVCGARQSIHGTPRNPGLHAKRLLDFVNRHRHDGG